MTDPSPSAVRPGVWLALVAGLVVVGGVSAWWLGREAPGTASPPHPSASAPKACTPVASAKLPQRPAPPLSPPRSTLVVEATVSVAALTDAVDARLPRTLDAAQRKPIGAAGEITYQVTRGRPKLSLEKGALVVDLPITASVEVCKPLGPICPTYGRCQPTLSSRTTLPLSPTPDWKLEGAVVSVAVQSGCTVAGLDATAEVKKAAATGRQRAQGQIAGALKRGQAELKKLVAGLNRPLPVGDRRCVKITPDAARYQPVAEASGKWVLAMAVDGAFAFRPCDAGPQDTSLPALKRAPLGDPVMRLATVVPYETVLEALRGRLPEGVAAVHALRPHGEELAVELTLEGERCGRTWAVARPQWSGDGLMLSNEAAFPTLAASLKLDPPPEFEPEAPGVTLTSDLKALPPELVVTNDGLAVVQRRSGKLSVAVDPNALQPK